MVKNMTDSLLIDPSSGTFGTLDIDGRSVVSRLNLSIGGTSGSGSVGSAGTAGFATQAGESETARAVSVLDDDGTARGLRLDRMSGDVDDDGVPFAPHQLPRWTLHGGGLAIEGTTGQWFLAPHAAADDPIAQKDALGLYFQSSEEGSAAVLVHKFETY